MQVQKATTSILLEQGCCNDSNFGKEISNITEENFGNYPESAFGDACSWYTRHLHGVLSSVICLVGIFSNIANAIVLTRKSLFSPVSLLLTSLATAECLIMGGYLMYSTHFYNNPIKWIWGERTYHTYTCILLLLIQQNIGICMHFYSMCTAVALASFRYIIIKNGTHSQLSRILCSLKAAKITIIVLLIIAIVASIPNALMQDIVQEESHKSEASYWFTESKFANGGLKKINFAIFGVCGKLLGSVLLGALSVLIIINLRKAQEVSRRIRKQR